MYVLHHADKPNLYSGLPVNPSISPMVALWKGRPSRLPHWHSQASPWAACSTT